MKVSVIVIVLMILCFIAGFGFGFRIKQEVYEKLLENWERTTKEHRITTHETLMTIINGYDRFFVSHKEILSMVKRNASNNCTGCEHINDDSGFCLDCYMCNKKQVKGDSDG